MAEKFTLKKSVTKNNQVASFDAPVFLSARSLDTGASSDDVLVVNSLGRIRKVPRALFASSGSITSTNVSASADTGTLLINLATQALGIKGGSNIATATSGSASILISLDSEIFISRVVATAPNASTFPLLIKDYQGNNAIGVSGDGILTFSTKDALPSSVTAGIIYISGSSDLDEGFYMADGINTNTGANPSNTGSQS